MGALAPVSSWTPEDDLLLKNAVEAGASLESLAKGAVRFAHRFTVRELQDRWFSLLYDPIVSAEASARMLEFERMLPSKYNRFGHSRDNKPVTGKRKAESVRNYYYALRKRICSEPFDSMDLSFLVAPTNSTYAGNEDGPGNCIPGDPISNPFGLEVSGMDNMTQAFPNNLMNGGAAISGDATFNLPTRLQNPAEENFLIEQNNTHKEIPHLLGENLPPTDLPEHGLLKAVELGVNSSPAFDQLNSDQSNMCLEFEGNKAFNSPVSGCAAPFNNMEYSPIPGMPIWKTVSAPALPEDIGLRDKVLCSGDTFHLPDDFDTGNTRTSAYGVLSDIKVKMEMDDDDFQIHNSPEGYLEELSNSLLNFTNEEELLFMNADGKDMIDKSYYDGLSSLLLNSPNDVGQEQTNNVTEPETSVAAAVCPTSSSEQCHAEPHDNIVSSNCDEQMSCDVQTQVQASISATSVEFPEYKDGVICCTLNTEDPEIPCNDDLFLPNHPASKSSAAQQKIQGANKPISSSIKNFSNNRRTNDGGPSLVQKERKTAGESNVSSQRIGSHAVQEMGLNPPVSNFGVTSAFSKSDLTNAASRVAAFSSVGPNQINTANTSTKAPLHEMRREETGEMVIAKHISSIDCSIKKPAMGSSSLKSYPQTNSIVIKEEHDMSAAIRDQESIHAESTSMNIAVSEPAVNAPTADHDGSAFESDDDVPCFSDVEAMILDMDLDPDDHNSNEEVVKYQHEGTKRAIIRLEQSAYSYMQRTIASHGAVAILYGRHSKHYIKKPEVLLGRATEDITVDIDLGREGRANKISRKQAIIKMDKGGSFHLKNLGKSSITVNSKEVGPKQSTSLNSSCLIEIRGMPFIFEANQTRVKMYLDSMARDAGPQEQQ